MLCLSLLVRSSACLHLPHAEHVAINCLHMHQDFCILLERVLILRMLLCSGVSYSEALGSARGAHSLGPSESDSEMGDMHPQAMDEAGRKAPQKLHAGHAGPDNFHEAASSRYGPALAT